jgi:hypothetical protein
MMHDVIHSPNDGIANMRMAPGQAAAVAFHPDTETGDTGAYLADRLGRFFLEGAVNGEDEDELAQGPEGELSERGELADLANEQNEPGLELEGEEPTVRPTVRPHRSRRQ